MFNHLSERLTKVVKNLRGQGRLTKENMADTWRDIRIALLEADVPSQLPKIYPAC